MQDQVSYFRVICPDCKKVLQEYQHAGAYNETRFIRCPECQQEKREKQEEENQIRRILEETGHL